jgi:hypothetical protein
MNTQPSQPRKIDFLQLSESQKTSFLKEAKEILRQNIEEAKFLRTLIESNKAIVDGVQLAF